MKMQISLPKMIKQTCDVMKAFCVKWIIIVDYLAFSRNL